jgi:transcriptional regulator with XRE-family HTH domain
LKLDRDRLQRAREMLGYGLEKTAEEAGISKNSVLRAEHEEDIRPVTARKIAAALDVRVADLIRESETLKAQASLPLEEGGARPQPRVVQGEAHLSGTGRLTAVGKIMEAADDYKAGKISREEFGEVARRELVPAL